MAQVKECLERTYDCTTINNAIPKKCLHSVRRNDCRCKGKITCRWLKDGFKYQQPCRPAPCKPPTNLCTAADAPFDDRSIYTNSFYKPENAARLKPIVRPNHLVTAGEFRDETVHKMSYQIPCAPVVQPIKPRDHCLGGTGPMRLRTTQQHDYYVPCDNGARGQKIVPQGNLTLSNCPMAKSTTTKFSYQPVCADPVESYKPKICYNAPEIDMDLNTVQRASYKNVDRQEKPDTPWAARVEYCKPKTNIECCTVYNYSYKEPGQYVLADSCGNKLGLAADSNLAADCCPFTCVANTAEDRFKSCFTKAHEFDD